MLEPTQIQPFQELPPIPRKVKIASSKILAEYGYTARQIEQYTGLPKSTVDRLSRKQRSDITEVDPETWDLAGLSITRLMTIQRTRLESKIMQKMEYELDTKPLPFGSLAFGLKVIGDINNPKGQTNVNVNGNQVAVQVIRGNVSYNNTIAKDKTK